MSIDQTDKLSGKEGPAPAGEAAPKRRFRRMIWPFTTGASEDTFATPSVKTSGEVDPESLTGPEPAVFGGAVFGPEPTPEEKAAAEAQQQAEAQAESEPLGTALDEAVRGDELLANAPKINFARIIRTVPFMLVMMIAMLIGASFFVNMAVPSETYVQMSVTFNNYTKLTQPETAELQLEISKLLRTYPLRKAAWELLQKSSPGVAPGFLENALTFHRIDAISWEPDGLLRLRLQSTHPADDITRLSAVTKAFYNELANRAKRLDDYKQNLSDLQKSASDMQNRDVELKNTIDAMLPEAQRYTDLKQAMQAMERYLELADESNPLRMVARQNLARLTHQVEKAREVAVKRDEMINERITLQKDMETNQENIAQVTRAIDVFAYPSPPDPSRLIIHDTRPHQRLILRIAWIGVVVVCGGAMALLHFIDARNAERLRRERRELLALAAKSK